MMKKLITKTKQTTNNTNTKKTNNDPNAILRLDDNNNNIIIILCTIPSDSKFTPFIIAKTLIDKKLAACVNILPNTYSVYHWENNVEQKKETQLFIKTHETLEESVFQQIKNKHPYQIPELLTLRVTNGEKKYLSWIYNTVLHST